MLTDPLDVSALVDSDERRAALSTGTELVSVSLYENVGFAQAQLYRDGELVWSVIADPSEHLPLLTRGEPPDAYDALAASAAPFEVPIELAEQVCGLRYDSTSFADEGDAYLPIDLPASAAQPGDRSAGRRPGLLGRLFGRR